MGSVYVPPAGGSGSCSGSCGTEEDNQVLFLSGYFGAHMLSTPSHRYLYLTWIALAGIIIILACFHHLGVGDQTIIGAVWNRWAVKNRVIKFGRKSDRERRAKSTFSGQTKGKGGWHPNDLSSSTTNTPKMAAKLLNAPNRSGPLIQLPTKRKIFTFPSFGRMILLAALLVIPIIFTLIGADYIRPSAAMFDMSESWPNNSLSTTTQGLYRRNHHLQKRLQWGLGNYNPVTTNPPSLTLPYRTWWTAGGRTGMMTNALTPFVVITALKQVPFALLSNKILGGYAFDRLSFMHKWGGRTVWGFATAHVILWSVQLGRDHAFGMDIWGFVFLWTRFRWGFVSYGFFTLLVFLSVGPMRADYYEIFYVCHVVCVIGFMVTAWLHHPPLGPWMWVTLLYWGAERAARALKVAWINGVGFAGRKPQFAIPVTPPEYANNGEKGAGTVSSHHFPYPNTYQQKGMPQGAYGHKSFKSQGGFSLASSHTVVSEGGSSGAGNGSLTGPNPSVQTFRAPMQTAYGAPPPPPIQLLPPEGPPEWEEDGFGGMKKRQTRTSMRYDPVYEVIDDYRQDDRNPLFEEQGGSVRYNLEDPGTIGGGPLTDSTPHSSAEHYSQQGHGIHKGGAANSTVSPSVSGSTLAMSAQGSRSPMAPSTSRQGPRPAMPADVAALIRPGYAFAQLLPGKTIRLTIRTPNRISWEPGQYVNLNTPSLRWWESHPFTIASAYNIDFPCSTQYADEESGHGMGKAKGEERTMVLLLRARRGFTLQLWNHVLRKREEQIQAAEDIAGIGPDGVRKSTTGVHLRAIIDGPYGSTKRVRWGIHSTVLIICGGSGVSFGMSVLEYLCAAMMGATKRKKKFQTQRVRFVWMLREFSHLQWIASALRRCIELVPPEMLQVDLYVTHFNSLEAPTQVQPYYARAPALRSVDADGFVPPSAPFASNSRAGRSRDSWGSVDEHEMATLNQAGNFGGPSSVVPIPRPMGGRFTEGPEQEEYDINAYDLTQFDGEDYSAPSAAEMRINERIRKEGKLRRAHTRKVTMKRAGGRGGRNKAGANEEPPTPSSSSQRQALASQRAVHEAATQPNAFEPPMPSVREQDLGESGLGSRDDYGDAREGLQPSQRRRSIGNTLAPPRPDPRFHHGSSSADSSYDVKSGSSTPYYDRSPPGSPGFFNASYDDGALSPDPRGLYSGAATPMDLTLGETSSTTHLLGPSEEKNGGGIHVQVNSHDAPIDLDAEEDIDLRVVAELARPGYPKLDNLIREERRKSKGRLLVSACGPQSLGTLIRSLVAKQIDPSKIRKGDLSAQINVVTESYEWGG